MAKMRMLDQETCPHGATPGRILVSRRDAPGKEPSVAIRLSRSADMSPSLVGGDLASAIRSLRRKAPAAGWGDGLVCLAAIEAATGKMPDPLTARARALVIQAEICTWMVRCACIEWPRLLGEGQELAPLRYANAAIEALIVRLWRGLDPFDPVPGGVRLADGEPALAALIEVVEAMVLPRAPADPAELAGWALRASAPIARLTRAASRLPLGDLTSAPGHSAGFTATRDGVAHPTVGWADSRWAAISATRRFGPVGALFFAQAGLAQTVVEGLAQLAPVSMAVHSSAPGRGYARGQGLFGAVVQRVEVDPLGRITAHTGRGTSAELTRRLQPLTETLGALPAPGFAHHAPLVLAAYAPGMAFDLQHDNAALP